MLNCIKVFFVIAHAIDDLCLVDWLADNLTAAQAIFQNHNVRIGLSFLLQH